MQDRFRSADWLPDGMECYDLVDGGRKQLLWVKGVNGRSGDYLAVLNDLVNRQHLGAITLKVSRESQELFGVNLRANDSNILLVYDGCGITESLTVIDNSHTESPCKIVMDWMGGVGGNLVAESPDNDQIKQTRECLRILAPNGRQQLLLEPLAGQNFGASSSLWKPRDWQVNLEPIRYQDLLVFSPKRWGDSALAPAAAKALTNILTAKIKPLT